jgi:chromosome segregation ATPase
MELEEAEEALKEEREKAAGLASELTAARAEAGKLKGRVTELSRALEAAEAKVESIAKVRAEAAGLVNAAEEQLAQTKAHVRVLQGEVRGHHLGQGVGLSCEEEGFRVQIELFQYT